MKDKILIILSLMLLILVLIGVTIIEPVSKHYSWIQPLVPMIVITGFFIFLISAGLFLYVILKNIKK